MSNTKRSALVRVGIIAGAAVVVAVVATVIWFSSQRPSEADAPREQPAASATDTPSGADIAELNDRLVSGQQTDLATALGLPLDEVTEDMTDGFAGLEIAWDTAGLEPSGGSAWVIPATVEQADGTTTEWSVTLVRSKDGLVFLDSQEVAP